MQILAPTRRSGRIVTEINPPLGQNRIMVRLPIDESSLPGVRPVAVNVTLEQSADGVLWWPIGGFSVGDVRAKLNSIGKDGQRRTLWGRFSEQLYRGDAYKALRFDQFGGAAYDLKNPEDGAEYYQLQLCSRLRLIVESSDRFTYGLEADLMRTAAPDVPIGRRSASLLGVFSAAESSGATTTGSRTSTSGSFITATAGKWDSVSNTDVAASTDNKSNTFTEPANGEIAYGSAGDWPENEISYNNAGTRGASHTISHTDQGNNSLGAQEWDGIEASPTIVASTTTGTGTAVSHSVSVSAASLVILVFGYSGSPTTFAVNGSTLAQEIDENSDQQACGVYYNVAQTGTPSVAATLAASRTWGAIIFAVTEAAAAGDTIMPQICL